MKQVFDFIQCSEDENKLHEWVDKKIHQKGGKVDMCKALTDMLRSERAEGRKV